MKRIRTPAYAKWRKDWLVETREYRRTYAKERYQRKKEYIKAQGKAHRFDLRLEVFSHYGGAVCVCCGLTEPLVLTLDHKNNDDNKHRREIGKGSKLFSSYQFYCWLKRNNFPPLPLQVMCYNCNCGRWRNGGVCPLHITNQ